MSHVRVYLPRPGSALERTIAPGSGIVGSPEDAHDGRIIIDIQEPSKSENIITWADRVHHAHSRHIHRSPTSSRMFPPASDLVDVGVFDERTGEVLVSSPQARAAVASWAGGNDGEQLRTAGARRYETLRTLRALNADPARRAQMPFAARACGIDLADL